MRAGPINSGHAAQGHGRRFRSARAWVLLGVLLPALAARAQSQAAPIPPKPSVEHRAAELLEWGRWKEARALVEKAMAAPGGSQDAPLLAYYAHILTGFGETDQALKWAQKATALDPNCMSCHLFEAEALGQRAKSMSHVRALLEVPKVRRELQRAEALDPKNGDVQWGWMRFELELPAVAGGSLEEAIKRCDQLAQVDAVDGQICHATIALSQHRPDQALADYVKAAQQYPNDPRGNFYAGMTLYQQGQYAEAEPYLARALSLQAESTLYSGYQAADLVRLHRLDEARKVLDAANALHPDSRLGDFLVAQALAATQQDIPWARQLLAEYMAVPPEPDQPTLQDAQQLLASLPAG